MTSSVLEEKCNLLDAALSRVIAISGAEWLVCFDEPGITHLVDIGRVTSEWFYVVMKVELVT